MAGHTNISEQISNECHPNLYRMEPQGSYKQRHVYKLEATMLGLKSASFHFFPFFFPRKWSTELLYDYVNILFVFHCLGIPFFRSCLNILYQPCKRSTFHSLAFVGPSSSVQQRQPIPMRLILWYILICSALSRFFYPLPLGDLFRHTFIQC